MINAIEAGLWGLMWRLTWWMLATVIRIFWLPILIVLGVYFVVIPGLIAIAQVLQVLIQPASAIAVALLVLWMWRRS